MNIRTMSRSTRRLAAGSLLALTAAIGLAACGDDEPAQQMDEQMEEQMDEQMEDTGSDVMTETTEAMMEDDSMTDDSMTDDSMTDDSMTETTTAP